ncbi:hypothetical protein K458DRAFT_426270 [Lentithecium fluviatile CBS 122367]|uniref:BTB domain-containing protein n=1 Tax=Lentithecium fluviatile CBS 122367 TaxID=1168545 RepID=A0A6G1JL07_9PLEO|nr:hypothetical protein K458DRAFT_426270 [Lentithecium fluviatile CBS 122367]
MASTEEPKPPSLSALARGNDMIVVSVGPTQQKYRIYKDLISFYSEYFRNALKEPWKEAEDRVIELPDIEPQVFDVFVDWLYSQKVPEKNKQWVEPTDKIKSNSTEHVQLAEQLVMKTYVFADRFMDCIPPYYEVIIYAFDNLTEKSAMLDLLVGLHCAFWDESCDTESNGELELRKELPVEFLLRVMIRSSKMKDKEKAKSLVECGCHREKAKDREGCESCRPEEKVEENKEDEEAPADGEAQNDEAAQANDGEEDDAEVEAEPEADAEGDEADDGAQEDDEATTDGNATGGDLQEGNGAPANSAEGSGEGTSGNDGGLTGGAPQASSETPASGMPEVSGAPPADGTSQVDGEPQSNDAGQTATGERTNEPVQAGTSSDGGDTRPKGEGPSKDKAQTSTTEQATSNASGVQAARAGGDSATAPQPNDVPVEAATTTTQTEAVPQGETTVTTDGSSSSNDAAAAAENSRLNDESRESATNAPVVSA